MPSQASESLTLRTFPFREGDLIVSFLTREAGRLRGVARAAKKPKSSFGSGLERLSHITMYYGGREHQELFSLYRCELIQSQIGIAGDYGGCVALDFLAEVTENLLPPAEPDERFFRLLLSVLGHLRGDPAGRVWPVVNYFSLWAVRLAGLLPELRVDADSRRLAEEIMQRPVGQLSEREWSARTAADLRRLLVRSMQNHVEHKLRSAALLETL